MKTFFLVRFRSALWGFVISCCALGLVIWSKASVSAAPFSGVGIIAVPINVAKGISMAAAGYDNLATVTICNGMALTNSEVTVDWKDGAPTVTKFVSTQPGSGDIHASHTYLNPGQYVVKFSGWASCQAPAPFSSTAFQFFGTTVANVYIPLPIASLRLIPAVLTHGTGSTTNIVTLRVPAYPWGNPMTITSSNPAIATILRGTIGVPPNGTSLTFTTNAHAPGVTTITATSGASSISRRLTVN
jgi:hypothetical protein